MTRETAALLAALALLATAAPLAAAGSVPAGAPLPRAFPDNWLSPPPAAAQAVYKYGKGRVFRPNPVNALKNTALKDNADADGPAFTPAYRTDWLRDLTYNGTTGTFSLQGPWVRVNDAKESPFLFPTTKGLVTTRDLQGRFMFVRTPDQFEHVMAYYHIDRNQRYIQGLGILGANQRQILVDPHAGATRYVPSPVGRGYLAFATAGVDDAEDADVILHEYAHAVQDNQAPGKYLVSAATNATEAAAMGEGFADYWAASATYDWSMASGFDPACIGEWNKAPACMDRVDSAKGYADKAGNAQADGQIWSAALWGLFQATGDRGATDAIVLQSHFAAKALPAGVLPTFKDGVDALLAADAELYAGAHQAQICSVMAARGIPTDKCGFTATVTWDNPLVDLDLRLRPPDGAGVAGWDYGNDCSSFAPHPDWGVAGDTADDPLLKSECRYTQNPGCHDEQIVLLKFTAPGTYDLLVHYYDHSGWQEQTTTATVRVLRDGVELFSGSEALTMGPDNLPDSGELWKAFTLTVP